MSGRSKSKSKSGFEAGRSASGKQSATEEYRAGIWITVVAALLTISAIDHLTRLPWFVTYPIAFVAALIVTAAYVEIKKFIVRKR